MEKKAAKKKNKIEFHFITIFPKIFSSYIGESLFKRAQKEKIVSLTSWNLRDFSKERHNKVDDKPFGGGAGMVLQVEPVYGAVKAATKTKKSTRVILFSTRGKVFTQEDARRLAGYDRLVFVCGRYEGVDERVADHIADEEISLGDFVLAGGELPALVVAEAVARHIPGFLGKEESLEEIKGSYPTYSRPAKFVWKKDAPSWDVPDVLISGNHAQIDKWRTGQQNPI